MAELTIYHNPRCSKSRECLAILLDSDADVEVIDYTKTPPDRETLERIVELVPDPPSELVRKDNLFSELDLDPDDYDSQESVVEVLLEHPMLMQRPVVVRGDRAVLGRPPENVKDLL